MKRIFLAITLIISVLAMTVISCGGHKKDDDPVQPTNSWSPAPGEGGTVPTSVLPTNLDSIVKLHFTVHTGENPNLFDGQFLSDPHVLMFTNYMTTSTDTVGSVYNSRYIAFYKNSTKMDFYGKQWDDDNDKFYNEAYRQLYVLGTGENFTCYYITEGYPNGMYAKQSTIFSGKWNESYGGLKDFQVAVILTETSNNPNLAPKGSFRVLGDSDGLAINHTWIEGKSADSEEVQVSAEDAFSLFRVR